MDEIMLEDEEGKYKSRKLQHKSIESVDGVLGCREVGRQ